MKKSSVLIEALLPSNTRTVPFRFSFLDKDGEKRSLCLNITERDLNINPFNEGRDWFSPDIYTTLKKNYSNADPVKFLSEFLEEYGVRYCEEGSSTGFELQLATFGADHKDLVALAENFRHLTDNVWRSFGFVVYSSIIRKYGDESWHVRRMQKIISEKIAKYISGKMYPSVEGFEDIAWIMKSRAISCYFYSSPEHAYVDLTAGDVDEFLKELTERELSVEDICIIAPNKVKGNALVIHRNAKSTSKDDRYICISTGSIKSSMKFFIGNAQDTVDFFQKHVSTDINDDYSVISKTIF